jgi:hypothetical protein
MVEYAGNGFQEVIYNPPVLVIVVFVWIICLLSSRYLISIDECVFFFSLLVSVWVLVCLWSVMGFVLCLAMKVVVRVNMVLLRWTYTIVSLFYEAKILNVLARWKARCMKIKIRIDVLFIRSYAIKHSALSWGRLEMESSGRSGNPQSLEFLFNSERCSQSSVLWNSCLILRGVLSLRCFGTPV